MKNFLAFAGMLVGVLFSVTATGQNINIPDADFKYRLRYYPCVDTDGDGYADADADTNNNGEISVSEAQAVIRLLVGSSGISSLEGIEYFTNLQTLNCYNNQLTSLTVLSSLTNLQTLNCSNNQLTSLTVLSSLTNLQTLNCSNNQLTSLTVLSSLTNLQALNCSNNQIVAFSVLSSLTNLQTLNCSNNLVAVLPISNLTNLQTLDCNDTELISLNAQGLVNLQTLNCFNNWRLTSLDLSGCTSLQTLNCNNSGPTSLNVQGCTSLQTLNCNNSGLTSLNVQGFTNLQTLDCANNDIENLNLQGCIILQTLNCRMNRIPVLNVSGFTALQTLDCYANRITSLDLSGLTNLQTLNCGGTLLTSLELSGLPSLQTISCYNNNQLISLNVQACTNLQTLYCYNNDLQTSLEVSGLSNLQTLNCYSNQLTNLDVSSLLSLQTLNCSNNQLASLFIKNGRNEASLGFANNPNLTYICADEGQLVAVQNKVNQYGLTNCVVNSYCSFVPGETFYTVEGQNKWDTNNNGCDANDPVYPNLKYTITNVTNTGVYISNETGNYSIPLQAGGYTITPQLENPDYFTASPSSVILNLPQDTLNLVRNFCITPNGEHHDVEVTIIPTIPARPGFNATYRITCKNKGNQVESDSITFTYQDDRMDFISASIAPDAQYANVLRWNYTNLQPFETRTMTVVMNINSPMETPAVNVGDVLSFNAVIYPYSTDEMPTDNSFNLRQIVVGSYDPNDKTCLEGTQIPVEKIGDYLHYLIRFENTGTYAAENIVVKDMIDTAKFDIRSLQLTETSHSCWVRVIGANRAEFIFENINLPFTEPDKHGYVAFKIKTKPNLVLGNTVTNQADIFFDYNFPITTNLTSTTIANSPVVATVSSLNNLNCTNATTVLTASGGWLYDFGSGFSQTATLTVNASGTYTVTVQDINGYTGTSTIVLAQDITPPTSSITNANELNCATPTSVITASGGVEYNFGNGFAAVNTMEVSESGTYTVIVKGANGCTASTEIAVTADLTPPIGSITNANELNCTTPTSVITASGGVEYNFGNGFAVVNTMEVSQIGTYIVTVKGANGCTASTEIAVTADLTPPTVLINASLSFPCTTITATGGGTYLWNTGETTASFTANQGDYTVTITGTNGCTATETQAITETVVSISQTGNTLIAPSGGNTYQWFWNEQPIEAATMAIYIPTESGNYRVEIGNEQGCIVSSSVLAYLYVSTASENNSAGIEIYPNPTNGMLTLQTKTPFNANQTITVSNLMGQTVHISNVLSQTTTNNIDISFLTAGVYFVAVRDSKTGDTKVVKILLQK